ncbi:protein-methionine-sulfoxide reductase heme-binding subunit MsrQ [Neorhizobium sp. JUb45]|uniref:protein-methionine-sulfoxide reductase heme-binding subunit MsrQ n=1 Tax=unclassified Neorhizobium TaxID=2629175 RepID=UPI001053F67E|nr:protein-methionine-sulfoxide reductase heme-binding subunit MsrQ [Neorhizobium sp. JUb45]TCR04723.1 sulfoxide reductase heme-binding subunit YedZ [Neorhizobium sp. JUb45]
MSVIPALPRKFHGPSIWALYVIGLCPAAWYFYLGATGGLGINPVKEFEHLLGLWALRFIIATLAVTPLRDLVGINWIRYRRALGLLAFYYVVMHFSVWMLLDLGMDVHAVLGDILKRPYISIGMVCLAALVPLAVTSNNYSIRRLGKLWIDMHHLIYPIALGGALHYFLAVKSITTGPFIHIAAIALLLAYRPLRKPIMRWKRARKSVDSPQPAHR